MRNVCSNVKEFMQGLLRRSREATNNSHLLFEMLRSENVLTTLRWLGELGVGYGSNLSIRYDGREFDVGLAFAKVAFKHLSALPSGDTSDVAFQTSPLGVSFTPSEAELAELDSLIEYVPS